MRGCVFFVMLVLLWIPLEAFSQSNRQLAEDSIQSKVLNVTRKYAVYLPKSYSQSKDKKYPVLYLLHGHNNRYNFWGDNGNLQEIVEDVVAAGKSTEMIIVMPDAASIQNGYFDMEGWKYETFFFEEFIPYVEMKYRILGDKYSRAIAGFSMGGGGATAYGIKHADMFSAVYAIGALMTLPRDGKRLANPPGDPELVAFGTSVLANDCIFLISYIDKETLRKLHTVKWFIDCADADFLLDVNTQFHREMKKAGIPCELRVRDGNHDGEYCMSALYTALPFISNSFGKN